jgi:hypothetical protein
MMGKYRNRKKNKGVSEGNVRREMEIGLRYKGEGMGWTEYIKRE